MNLKRNRQAALEQKQKDFEQEENTVIDLRKTLNSSNNEIIKVVDSQPDQYDEEDDDYEDDQDFYDQNQEALQSNPQNIDLHPSDINSVNMFSKDDELTINRARDNYIKTLQRLQLYQQESVNAKTRQQSAHKISVSQNQQNVKSVSPASQKIFKAPPSNHPLSVYTNPKFNYKNDRYNQKIQRNQKQGLSQKIIDPNQIMKRNQQKLNFWSQKNKQFNEQYNQLIYVKNVTLGSKQNPLIASSISFEQSLNNQQMQGNLGGIHNTSDIKNTGISVQNENDSEIQNNYEVQLNENQQVDDLQDYGQLQIFKQKSKARGRSAQSYKQVHKYVTRQSIKEQIKQKKEYQLQELQQSRKNIMIQRLDLYNLRDDIELFLKRFKKSQSRAYVKAKKNQTQSAVYQTDDNIQQIDQIYQNQNINQINFRSNHQRNFNPQTQSSFSTKVIQKKESQSNFKLSQKQESNSKRLINLMSQIESIDKKIHEQITVQKQNYIDENVQSSKQQFYNNEQNFFPMINIDSTINSDVANDLNSNTQQDQEQSYWMDNLANLKNTIKQQKQQIKSQQQNTNSLRSKIQQNEKQQEGNQDLQYEIKIKQLIQNANSLQSKMKIALGKVKEKRLDWEHEDRYIQAANNLQMFSEKYNSLNSDINYVQMSNAFAPYKENVHDSQLIGHKEVDQLAEESNQDEELTARIKLQQKIKDLENKLIERTSIVLNKSELMKDYRNFQLFKTKQQNSQFVSSMSLNTVQQNGNAQTLSQLPLVNKNNAKNRLKSANLQQNVSRIPIRDQISASRKQKKKNDFKNRNQFGLSQASGGFTMQNILSKKNITQSISTATGSIVPYNNGSLFLKQGSLKYKK